MELSLLEFYKIFISPIRDKYFMRKYLQAAEQGVLTINSPYRAGKFSRYIAWLESLIIAGRNVIVISQSKDEADNILDALILRLKGRGRGSIEFKIPSLNYQLGIDFKDHGHILKKMYEPTSDACKVVISTDETTGDDFNFTENCKRKEGSTDSRKSI